MANNNRYNPVIDGFKVCKVCSLNKELATEYSFHKATGYYSGVCKTCKNETRRLSHPLLSGRREGSVYIRQKVCIKCNIPKDINTENFTTNGRNFAKVCRECSDKIKKEKSEKRLNQGPYSKDRIKTCNICKEDKNIDNFSYSKKYKFYSYCCKSCDSKRKKEKFLTLSEEEKEVVRKKGRDWHKSNKPASLRTSYYSFDLRKNLENDLTQKYIEAQLSRYCTYCGHTSTGLDRINNNLGHLQSNCVPCCWECNTARNNNFSYDEMLILGKAIKEIKDKRNQT